MLQFIRNAFKIFWIFSLVYSYKTDCYPLTTNNGTDEISDYYWREYTGIIPGDAIPGGIDTSGSPTYCCDPYFENQLPEGPSRISPILCSRNLNKYKWIVTKNEETHLLTTCHLVIGGTEAGFVINIGRVLHELETVIGKVFAHHTPYRGLSIPYGKKEATYQSYEILTYDCDVDNILDIGNVTYIGNVTIYK